MTLFNSITNKIWEERRFKTNSNKYEFRSAYERDRARVIHSAALRRMQSKTQILGVQEGDFHRTRLTHSLEVAQIGGGIVHSLKKKYPDKLNLFPNNDIIETIGLSHDLGHPPFGHGGEAALNFRMCNYGGFESNAQSIRLLGNIESHTPKYGLNLTRRSMLGVLKYPSSYSSLCKKYFNKNQCIPDKNNRLEWNPPKCFFDSEKKIIDWILEPLHFDDIKQFLEHSLPSINHHGKTKHKSLDTSILDLADDIAYGIHDLEDAIALKLINRDHWQTLNNFIDKKWLNKMYLSDIENLLFSNTKYSGHYRKQGIGKIVSSLVNSIEIHKKLSFKEPLLIWNAILPKETLYFLNIIKEIVTKNMINLNTVQSGTFRGHRLLLKIFEAFENEPNILLPKSFYDQWKTVDGNEKKRIICDYVSGMTDKYANKIYSRLFIPEHGSVFDRL